jgi:two-component system, OmpR family, response regulator
MTYRYIPPNSTSDELILRAADLLDISSIMSAPIHILIVDDDPAIRLLLRQGLEPEGFSTWEAANEAAVLTRLKASPVNLIILDLNLGDQDGLALARRVRATYNVPIVMVTSRVTTEDRILGLESGADDYITKPFHFRELLLRVRNVLRRYGPIDPDSPADTLPDQTERFQFDAGVLDVSRRELKAPNGYPIELTNSEFDLLTILLRQPLRILSRDEMMQLLRGRDWLPLERTIDGHIARLRRKIEPPGDAPRLIKTVHGVGYVYTGEAKRI